MIERILAAIDVEIAQLTKVRTILSPKTTGTSKGAFVPERKRRPLSKAARAKIAAAQRERWKRQKANASKKAG